LSGIFARSCVVIKAVKLAGISFCGLMVQTVYGATNLPPELGLAIKAAITHHPEVNMAESDVLAAKAIVEAGGYRWYPKVEVSSRMGSNQSGGAGNRSLNLVLKQSLWDAGRVDADYDSAKASESVSLSAEVATQEDIGTRASSAYFSVSRARAQKQVARRSVEDHRNLYNSVDRRKVAGLGSLSDVTLASSRLQQAIASEVQWQGEINRAEAAYLSVVNELPPDAMPELDVWEVDGELKDFITVAKVRSPVLQKLRNQLLVAEANVKSKKAQQFPTLYASVDHASYLGGATGSLYQDDTRFTVNFEWQNDVALTQRYQVEAAEQKVISARYAVESAERQLVETLTGYWQDYTTSRQRRDELKKFEDSAAETVGMFRRQFSIGRRSWPEVMNSLQDLYGAQNQQVEAKYQVMTARLKIAFLIGEMDEYLRLANDGTHYNQPVPVLARDPAMEKADMLNKVKENIKHDLTTDILESEPEFNEIATAPPVQVIQPTIPPVLDNSSTRSLGSDDQKLGVNEALVRWVNAWSSRNVDDYLACYASDFSIPNGGSRADWENERRNKIIKKASILVELKQLKITITDNEAKASFRQIYTANGKVIRSNKSMSLRRYGNGWLIVKEKIAS